MSSHEKPPSSSECISAPYPDGKMKERSQPSKPHLDKDVTMSKVTREHKSMKEQPSSTPEYPPAPNNPILIDKLPTYANSTLEPKLSAKSVADSTSKGKNLFPYWNESCKVLSSELLSPIKTDSRALDLSGSSGSANSIIAQSWFSTNESYLQKQKWLKTSLPSSTAFQVDCTDCANTKILSRKIKVYPTKELNLLWNKWLAACRYCYNQAISYQKQNGKTSKLSLRNIIMQSDLPEWVKETPCHIRQNAIFDAHQAYTASKDCKFRSHKAPRQSIKFNNSNYKKGKWYPNLTKNFSYFSSESLPGNSDYSTSLIKVKSKGWFAVFITEIKPEIKELDLGKVIALDPGVRTFLTGFDGQKFVEFGAGDIGRISRLCSHLDSLMSKISLSKSKRQRSSMRKAAQRMRIKIRNLVDECHKKAASWLTKEYQIIFLPKFETSEMTKKKKRKIHSKTARMMLTWAHYRFKQVLKNKAELNNCQVIDVTEEFTSKTCGHCGHVHQKLGGNKIFKCPECGYIQGRDKNGAFGILLKALSDTTFTRVGDALVMQYGNIPHCTA